MVETFPSKLLVTLAFLLAPLLEARKLGGLYDHEHLRLPSDGAIPSELNKVLHGVSRSGGRAPPAPKPGYPPHPGLQEPHEGGGGIWAPGVSNRQQVTPPPPIRNTPPQPGLQETHEGGGGVWAPCVWNRQRLTPPPPIRNTPPQYLISRGDAMHVPLLVNVVEVLRALWDDVIGA